MGIHGEWVCLTYLKITHGVLNVIFIVAKKYAELFLKNSLKKSFQKRILSIINIAKSNQNNILEKMQTRKRLYELVEYEKYNTPDKKITDFSTEGHE